MNENFSQSSQAYFVVEGGRLGEGDVTCASSEAQISGASPFLAQSKLVLSSHALTHTQTHIHACIYKHTLVVLIVCVLGATCSNRQTGIDD